MPAAAQAILLSIFILATSIWVGGFITIIVVARAARTSLDAAHRVAFFRALGRGYIWAGTPALIVAFGLGIVLLSEHPMDGLLTATVIVGIVLVVLLAIAVAQARRMTRLRHSALESSNEELASQIARGGRSAGMLRGILGVLSIALLVMGSFLAVL